MDLNGSSANGGLIRANTGTITRWKMIRAEGIGCSGLDTMEVKSSLNGLYMDFLLKR
jgi:hypothetical protein